MLGVPTFGREEDAADQISAYIMLHLGKAEVRRLRTRPSSKPQPRRPSNRRPSSEKGVRQKLAARANETGAGSARLDAACAAAMMLLRLVGR